MASTVLSNGRNLVASRLPISAFLACQRLESTRNYSRTAEVEASECLPYDVCIVGAGPAGLAAAIKFKQLCKEKEKDYSVCVLEKGAEVGAHTLSGCVMDPKSMNELLPGWREDPEVPLTTPVTADRFEYLTSGFRLRLPTPKPMHNKGNYILSLSELVRFLAKKAEALGVDVLPGYAAQSAVFNWNGAMTGVLTKESGRSKTGGVRACGLSLGVEITARATLIAEGCRGSVAESVIERLGLRKAADAQHQTYGLGIKEVWEVPEEKLTPGLVVHTMGYPLDQSTYGGGFVYHMSPNRVLLGLVVGLDYANPYLSPYQEFQRWKLHPAVRKHIEGGTCIQYGARALNEGGEQSLPQLGFKGGALLGCAAGTLIVPRIKGVHTAIASGMIAAEGVIRQLTAANASTEGPLDLSEYDSALRSSVVMQELHEARNVRPGFRFGLFPGLALAALDAYIFRGKAPWTLRHRFPDHECTKPAKLYSPIDYPKPDGKITFDIPTSLYRSGTNHEHDQPSHLVLKNPGLPEVINKAIYDGPEERFCPAGVYEYQTDEVNRPHLEIHAQNCLHCKACSIKDPRQNIKWTVPEGGGGPSYTVM